MMPFHHQPPRIQSKVEKREGSSQRQRSPTLRARKETLHGSTKSILQDSLLFTESQGSPEQECQVCSALTLLSQDSGGRVSPDPFTSDFYAPGEMIGVVTSPSLHPRLPSLSSFVWISLLGELSGTFV